MKRKMLIAVLLSALMLCGCNNKKDSGTTESRAETTTTTGLTIASQETTKTEGSAPVTKAAEENTVFTAKQNGMLTSGEKDDMLRFCDFIVHKWAVIFNKQDGELNKFDFTPCCKYAELARYMVFSGQNSYLDTKLPDSAGLTLNGFELADNAARLDTTYEDSTGSFGRFIFLVENVDGKYVLSDMLFDRISSLDSQYRAEQLKKPDPDYWSLDGRFNEIVDAIDKDEKGTPALRYSDSEKQLDKDKVEDFCNYIIHNWAQSVNSKQEHGLEGRCKYKDLSRYLDFAASIHFGRMPDTAGTELKATGFEIKDGIAKLEAVYQNSTGAFGRYYFFVEIIDGKMVLNDMIMDLSNSADAIYRPELLEKPEPDYWAKGNRYDEIIRIREDAIKNSY